MCAVFFTPGGEGGLLSSNHNQSLICQGFGCGCCFSPPRRPQRGSPKPQAAAPAPGPQALILALPPQLDHQLGRTMVTHLVKRGRAPVMLLFQNHILYSRRVGVFGGEPPHKTIPVWTVCDLQQGHAVRGLAQQGIHSVTRRKGCRYLSKAYVKNNAKPTVTHGGQQRMKIRAVASCSEQLQIFRVCGGRLK